MATSVIAALIDALFAEATAALPSVLVIDGQGATDDIRPYLLVGVDDPDGETDANSVDSSTEWAHPGSLAGQEFGSVSCTARAWNGDGNAKTARDDAFAIVNEVATICARVRKGSDSSLRELVPGLVSARVGRHSLKQGLFTNGAAASVRFDVVFTAHI